ncbi:hypothetical protein [Pseudoduganella buxea]|uniref:Uncharacterized protein n=1 Tax=Pseudoduganella buxea TaxID=1949069 RepID=A0A6I3T3C0_9BURK|nr:hypothetical protein [Pseudoduganella buxea]MTV56001.1 hypothetical protein [Pseudoduganella buxea]
MPAGTGDGAKKRSCRIWPESCAACRRMPDLLPRVLDIIFPFLNLKYRWIAALEIHGHAKVIPGKILRGFQHGRIKENQRKEAGVVEMKRGICALRLE